MTRSLNELAGLLASGAVAPVVVDGQPILCVSVYETPRSQAEMYLLKAGQRIPAHKHSAIDDVFVGVRGKGNIRMWDASGKAADTMGRSRICGRHRARPRTRSPASLTSIKNPFSPSTTSSPMAPRRLTTTQSPIARASRETSP